MSLKRSQKLCPKCGAVNPIRTYKCKKCSFEFPKKDKLVTQNNTLIEEFLFKKSLSDTNEMKSIKKFKEEKSSFSSNHENKNLDHFFKNELPKEKNYIEILSLIKNYNKDFIKISNDHIEKYINIFYEDNKLNCIKFPYSSIFPECSFDIQNTTNINKLFVSILFREEKQLNNLFSIMILIGDNKNDNIIKIYKYEDINANINENTEKELLYSTINTKIISTYYKTIIFSLSYQNILSCNLLNFNNDTEIIEIFKINTKNLIINSEFMFLNSKQKIRVLLSNSNNIIYYYLYESTSEKINLIGVYDNLFLYEITDIKFLDINTYPDNDNYIFYFIACSREGLLYILNNFGEIIFQHKTYQTWITQCSYDYIHNILIFLTNFDDKIVGIKFNANKEPIIKRIPETNNSYYCMCSPYIDKFFYLDDKGNIYSINSYYIEDILRCAKCKIKDECKPKFEYAILNDESKGSFTNRFKLTKNFNNNFGNKKSIIIILSYNKELRFVHL